MQALLPEGWGLFDFLYFPPLRFLAVHCCIDFRSLFGEEKISENVPADFAAAVVVVVVVVVAMAFDFVVFDFLFE